MDANKTYITDGRDLADKVSELKDNGITDIIVNVKTFNFQRYEQLYPGEELKTVIDGINAATGAKLHVTLHVEIKEDYNEAEVLDFLQLTFQHKYDIVFMPTISYDFLKSKMPALRKIDGNFDGVEMYKYPSAFGRIGFIID